MTRTNTDCVYACLQAYMHVRQASLSG